MRRIRIVTAGLGVAAAAASLGIAAVVQNAHEAAAVAEEPVATTEQATTEDTTEAENGTQSTGEYRSPVRSSDQAPQATSGGS